MYNFCFYFLLFLVFSIIGWIIECFNCSVIQKKIVIDRGFMLGPYCPIYGIGTLFIYLFLSKCSNLLTFFLLSMIISCVFEYITSYLMEKLFNARWWDYSREAFNINGRICLKNAFLFGIMSVIFNYLLLPLYINLVCKLPSRLLIIISTSLLLIFLIDYMLSFCIINKVKNKIIKTNNDSTSDMYKEVRKVILHKK